MCRFTVEPVRLITAFVPRLFYRLIILHFITKFFFLFFFVIVIVIKNNRSIIRNNGRFLLKFLNLSFSSEISASVRLNCYCIAWNLVKIFFISRLLQRVCAFSLLHKYAKQQLLISINEKQDLSNHLGSLRSTIRFRTSRKRNFFPKFFSPPLLRFYFW